MNLKSRIENLERTVQPVPAAVEPDAPESPPDEETAFWDVFYTKLRFDADDLAVKGFEPMISRIESDELTDDELHACHEMDQEIERLASIYRIPLEEYIRWIEGVSALVAEGDVLPSQLPEPQDVEQDRLSRFAGAICWLCHEGTYMAADGPAWRFSDAAAAMAFNLYFWLVFAYALGDVKGRPPVPRKILR